MSELEQNPIHLGLGATAVPQPPFTGEMSWYEGYGGRHGEDGIEGRLVSQHTFSADWDVWEMHPHGDELVYLLEGDTDFLLHMPDGVKTVRVSEPGSYVLVPKGVWHTGRPHAPTRMLFVTPGEGTMNEVEPPV